MKSEMLGTSISEVEVTNIDSHGFWVFVNDNEYFLPFEDYPWLKYAAVSEVVNVELLHESHLHWPALDVHLSIGCLQNPDAFPLRYH